MPSPETSAPSADPARWQDSLAPAPAGAGPSGATAAARRLWKWRHFDVVALALLVASITVLNQIWITTETRPPHWDMARHLGDSLVYYQAFASLHPLHWLELYLYYPPLTYYVADAFYAVFGTGTSRAVLSNTVFLAILAYSTYGIGKRLWSRRTGLLAVVFVLSAPVVVTTFKEFMLDEPLNAMVALALYLLIRSDSFRNTGPSLLLGAACGLGLLTKWTFPAYVALPLLFAALVTLERTWRSRSPRPLVNLAGAALVAFAICGWWYVSNWSQLHHDLTYFAGPQGATVGSPPEVSWASLGFYFWALLNYHLFVLPFLALAIGIGFVCARHDAARRNLLPMLLLIGSYAILTLLQNKDVRFVLPVLPAVAVVGTSWLEYLGLRLRRALSGVVIVYSAIAFLAVSFGTSLLPADATIGTGGTSPGITFFAQRGYIIGPPSSEHWYQQQVFEQIAHGGRTPTFWFTGSDSIWFNTWGTRYYALLYDLSWVASPEQASWLVYRDVADPSVPSGFGKVGSWTLPDGEPLYLFKRFL